VNARGARVGEVAVRHAAEIAATDVSGTEPGPAHSSAAEMPHTGAAEMRTTEMRSATSEVSATTATAPTAPTMTMRPARAGSENERGERNCRDERFDYLVCHRSIPSEMRLRVLPCEALL